jgi:hypothetical protein
MFPAGSSLQMSNSATATATTDVNNKLSSGQTGQTGSIVNSYNFGSGSLSSAAGSLPAVSSTMWWIIGGAAALVAAWFVWKGHKR